MVVVDRRGVVLFANPAAVRMLRPGVGTLIGTEFGYPVAVDLTEIEVSATGVAAEMRVSTFPWEGRPVRLITLRDITTRRRTLREQSRVISVLTEAERVAGIGSWEIDISSGRVWRSPGAMKILEQTEVTESSEDDVSSPPELLGRAVHPGDRERWRKAMNAALVEQRFLDMEFRMMLPGGGVRTVHAVGEPVTGPDGRSAKVLGVIRDVTREHRAVEALSLSEERFRLLAEHSPDVIFRCALEPRPAMEYVSPAAESVLGVPAEDVLGDPERCLALLHPEDRATLESRWRSMEQEPALLRLIRPDGGITVWVEARLTCVRDATGRTVAVEGNLRDVTARVAAEQERLRLARQLRQAERMEALGRLAGGVAHDFNNLLAVIVGMSELLAEDLPPEDPRHADVQRISEAAQRGASLTRQLLIFSRRDPSRPELLDVGDTVAGLEDILRRTIGEDIEFVHERTPGLPAVRLDPGKLEQVVLNLVVNARAAMPEGGRILLRTDKVNITEPPGPVARPGGGEAEHPRPGEYVRLMVTDTGCGMEPEVARKAFEPFFTTRGPGKGSGLGLATVHGVVSEAGGHVTLESTPGSGTTVVIHLPAAAAHVEAPEPEEGTDLPQGNGETVLVVEDEEPVREVVTRVLSRNNYRPLTARDAVEALELCADPDNEIDLLLTDMIMPGMPGLQLAVRVHETARPDLPVIYMSGYTAGQQPRDEGLHGPAPMMLVKPFEAVTALRRIRETLDARGGDATPPALRRS